MSICSVILNKGLFQMSAVKLVAQRTIYHKPLSGSLTASALSRHSPVLVPSSVKILRHLSVTQNLQIFTRLTSFLKKLANDPYMPERPPEYKYDDEAEERIESMGKEILEQNSKFLKEYDKNLNLLEGQVKPPPKEISKIDLMGPPKRIYKKSVRREKSEERLRFFYHEKFQPGKPVVTPQFRQTYDFLQSIEIPCDELQYFPDIQRMTEGEILMCIERLKVYQIHRVFSLFLIHRALMELKLGIIPPSISGKDPRKGRFKPISELKTVKLYLQLCDMLKRPDLDIISLLDNLIVMNGYESIETLHTKVNKLLSVGATADDIWSDLGILGQTKEMLNRKINLYKHWQPAENVPFPATLFANKSFVQFQKKLQLSEDVIKLAQMLDVSTEDFQACWGRNCYLSFNLPRLVRKVQMCVGAGISKKDIFNNLSVLNWIPMDKCFEVTKSFKESGLPVSIFILEEMGDAMEHNGTLSSGKPSSQRKLNGGEIEAGQDVVNLDWTGAQQGAASGEDNSPSSVDLCDNTTELHVRGTSSEPETTLPAAAAKLELEKRQGRNHKIKIQASSKRNRRALIKFVSQLLDLDKRMVTAVFRCELNTIALDRLDITQNLDFLVDKCGFSKEQIAKCPLILLNPHEQLKTVLRTAEYMVDSYLASSSFTPLETAGQSGAGLPAWEGSGEVDPIGLGQIDETENYQARNASKRAPKHSVLSSTFTTMSTSSSVSTAGFSTSSSVDSSYSEPLNETEADRQESEGAGGESSFHSSLVNTVSQDSQTHTETVWLKKLLLNRGVRHLNLLQYLLERDSSFSMGSTDANISRIYGNNK